MNLNSLKSSLSRHPQWWLLGAAVAMSGVLVYRSASASGKLPSLLKTKPAWLPNLPALAAYTDFQTVQVPEGNPLAGAAVWDIVAGKSFNLAPGVGITLSPTENAALRSLNANVNCGSIFYTNVGGVATRCYTALNL